MATGRYLRFDLTICRPWKPYPRVRWPVVDMAIRNSTYIRHITRGTFGTPHFKGRRGRRGSISYYWKQRWWFPTLHYHHTFGRNLSSNLCDVQFNMGMDGSLL